MNKLNLEVGMILNTKNAEQTLKDLDARLIKTKDYKINVKVGDELVKAVKTVNTLTDAYGNLYKQVKLTNAETGQPLLVGKGGNQIKEITEAIQGIQKLNTEVHKWTDTKGAVQTWSTTVDSSGKIVSTRVKEVVDEFGKITKTTSKLVSEGAGKPFHKMGEDIVEVSDLLKEVNTTTTKSFGKITDTIDGVTKTFNGTITTIKQVKSNGEELTTVINKYTNEAGQAVERTEQFNKAGVQVATTQRKISQDLTNTDNALKTTSKDIEIVKNDTGEIVKTIVTVNEQGERLKTTITTSDDGLGKLTTTTRVYNETLEREVSLHKETVNNQLKEQEALAEQDRLKKQLLTTINEMGNAAQNSSGKVQTLGSSFASALAQLTRFYVASLPLRAVTTMISETTQAVTGFDEAITEMGKVSVYSGEQLKKYTEDLGKLGQEVARTRTEMTDAATGWLKAGYSEEDAARLAKISSLLQNTADEELSAAEATSILVSQLKAYHMEADEAIRVTDIINAVSAEQAVSSADIAKGLTVASASMATFGNSIEETTALLTAGTTIFQGRSQQVARGLNMIATRVAKNEEELAKYDVSVKDSNGELRSTYDILTDLAPKWEEMSKAEQVALGNTLAG